MDSNAACEKISAIWLALGEQIAGEIPDFVIEGRPEEAIRWAQCAEACLWQATGESTAFDVKEVAATKPTPLPGSEG